MFKTPYDTTVCKNFLVRDKIKPELTSMLIAGSLHNENGVYFVTQEHKDVKPFTHPILLEVPSRQNDLIMVIDARGISSINQADGKLRKTTDLEYQVVRTKLMIETWLKGNTTDVLNLGDLQLKVFARLLSETLARRLNLDVNVQSTVSVISAFYYICMFSETYDFTEDDYLKYAKRISRVTHIQINEVFEMIKTYGNMRDLDSYCRALAGHGGSVRLEKMTPGLIYTMLGGVWFGSNSMEHSAVSLEHPPTFAAMVFMAVSDRSYRKTVLAQLISKVDARGELSNVFAQNVRNVIRGS